MHFPLEIQCHLKGKQIPNSSSVLNLSPFLDKNSILRVGGRLKHSSLTVNQKHPMLISNKSHNSNLLINYYPVFHFHTGVESTIANIRSEFWIINCRNKEGKEKIENFIASEGIVWHFNPPATPHFGDLWEAGIKILKSHLKRVIGNTIPTYEEFVTLVTQVEAVLNSRPLTKLSSDPNDSILTPAHFWLELP
ncbi:uncharacterized protein TNCV_2691971 [Trichonephila clavipes]|uniref:Integrase catalytic domain-containing protein n=1 Tax=Trichonephila clavipes TaxID=2585209 RepID=A0A8X7BAE2_TRICX|nr:uncharacterized protein TNCV_2691971 [Trichonephila clavipes]